METRALIAALAQAWRDGDALRAGAFFGPEASYQEAGHEAIVGRDAICAHFQRFFRDGPLWRFEVDEVLVEGERAVVCYRFAVKGADDRWRERAGCAYLRTHSGQVNAWREYHG